ncbi:hypothetical protein [Enterococcus ratti]|uniref:Uncharacterized protein n=2 Tax=Enterococcus ratti TaxID=150033 RepID=A0A1L8WRL0_9ENTE|nr:hypothetical protein RV14_GL000872 [Enterococcus ratti]
MERFTQDKEKSQHYSLDDKFKEQVSSIAKLDVLEQAKNQEQVKIQEPVKGKEQLVKKENIKENVKHESKVAELPSPMVNENTMIKNTSDRQPNEQAPQPLKKLVHFASTQSRESIKANRSEQLNEQVKMNKKHKENKEKAKVEVSL